MSERLSKKEIAYLRTISGFPALLNEKSVIAKRVIENGYADLFDQYTLISPKGINYLDRVKDVGDDELFCSKCVNVKSKSEFYTSPKTKSGFVTYCKECITKYNRDRHSVEKEKERFKTREALKVNPDFIPRRLKASRKYYASEYGKAQNLWRSAKKSKASKIHPFTLTFEHVYDGVKRGTCAVTGWPFDLRPSRNHYRNPFAPSLDRIVTKGPYSDDNVRVVLNQFNIMKAEISDLELYLVCKAFVEVIENGN